MGNGTTAFLTLPETAKHLRLSTRTIHRLMHQGIPVYKVGQRVLFDRDEVTAWVRNNFACVLDQGKRPSDDTTTGA